MGCLSINTEYYRVTSIARSETEVLKENNYYPYGIEWKGFPNTVTGGEHRWKFQNESCQIVQII